MAYRISYKKSVHKDLASLSKAEARRVLDKIEKELTTLPECCLPLKGQFAGLRKLRVGDYRVIFVVQEEEVLVLRIGHRREIYDR
ncbi:MAG: type II toxin-antitoxin system RelE/ParE family toxin [Planctomycetota bacterium]